MDENDINVYIVNNNGNVYNKKYIVTTKDKIIYPQQEDLLGMTLKDWISENPNKLKEKIGKNGGEIVNYLGKNPKVELLDRNPGDYYPRVWEYGDSVERRIPEEDYEFFTNSINQFVTINNDLHNVFKYIKPTKDNKLTYGNKNRNVIMQACTEIETQFIQILEINGYPHNKNYSTKDFYKLKKLMMLDMFTVKLKYFPTYEVLKPYFGWDIEQSTKSIKWYDSYNKIKHDREKNFKHSTLESAIEAVCGLYILLIGQYGLKNVERELYDKVIFQIVRNPLKLNVNVSFDILGSIKPKKIKYFEKG